jgi:hypothetical protein
MVGSAQEPVRCITTHPTHIRQNKMIDDVNTFINHYFSFFPNNEKNEILRWLIVFLWRYLIDDSGVLEVTELEISYSVRDKPNNVFPLKSTWATNWIIELDKLMKKTDMGRFLILISQDKNKRTYKKA